MADNQTDWDTHRPYAVAAYRATTHESTGYSPNFLMFGHEVRAPLDVVMGLPMSTEQSSVSIDEFVEGKVERMRAAYRSVRENLGKAAERQKRYYDHRFNQTTKCGCGAPVGGRVYRLSLIHI